MSIVDTFLSLPVYTASSGQPQSFLLWQLGYWSFDTFDIRWLLMPALWIKWRPWTNSTCQSSAAIYFALGKHNVLALSGWSDCWLWINIYIRASGHSCLRCDVHFVWGKTAKNCKTSCRVLRLLKKRKRKNTLNPNRYLSKIAPTTDRSKW